MDKKQNTILYMGLIFILVGTVFLLKLNDLLPVAYLSEIANIILAVVCTVLYFKKKELVLLMLSTFFWTNGLVMIIGNVLYTRTYLVRLVLIPGIMLLVAYFAKRKSVLSILGSLFTAWGIFLFTKGYFDFNGFLFCIGFFLVFTAAAFALMGVLEKETWPIVPILAFGGIGFYLIIGGFSPEIKNIALQISCVMLIVIGVIFVMKSMFKKHSDDKRE